jgi:hypothetical protein
MKKCFLLVLLFSGLSLSLSAQGNTYKNVDDVIQKLGPLDNFNVAVIADTLTRGFESKEDKARAIYYWIANNIALDGKATKMNETKNNLPEKVVQLRKATPLGFSLLVQEMCSWAKIRCLSVDGYIKNFPEDINEKPDEFNHSWNVVQLGQSPDTWYYIDASKAAGLLDKKMAVFTKHFTSEYFFADRKLFNLDHYPDNTAWQLGTGSKSVKEFYGLPVISNAAYEYGVQKLTPANGYIKIKANTPVNFSFPFNGKTISSIHLIIGDARKQQKPEPMNFTSDGTIAFSYKFKVADTYPVKIMVDGREFVSYLLEVTE